MLLVSAEKGGCVSHTVGGGPAAEASPQHAPFELPPGEATIKNVKLRGHLWFLVPINCWWRCCEDS